MALNLHTVEGMVRATRGLLLDSVQPYRYSDIKILVGLNLAILEAKRLRADFFVRHNQSFIPQYEEVTGEVIPVEPQFRVGFLFGIAAYVLLTDEEDVQDSRADTFLTRFRAILTGVDQTPIKGGTPSPQQTSKVPK